jgi:hypothetical protein
VSFSAKMHKKAKNVEKKIENSFTFGTYIQTVSTEK